MRIIKKQKIKKQIKIKKIKKQIKNKRQM